MIYLGAGKVERLAGILSARVPWRELLHVSYVYQARRCGVLPRCVRSWALPSGGRAVVTGGSMAKESIMEPTADSDFEETKKFLLHLEKGRKRSPSDLC